MSADDKTSGADLLGDAVSAFLAHRASGAQTDAEFLRAHPELRQLLEPMMTESENEEPEMERSERVLGDFRLVREIGRGGMGLVFEAEQISLGRRVALKLLRSDAATSARQIERFRREASAASRLRHPGIVPIFEVGEEDGTHFFAMEFVEGHNLQHWIESAQLQCAGKPAKLESSDGMTHVERCAEVCAQVADALQAAHSAGVIHRDIKPQNILLDEKGKVRVVDFGLAKDRERISISGTSDFAGTPHYMSPEQVRGLKGVDARSDVFSLGVVLYELLALEPPFDGDTTLEIFQSITNHEARSPRSCNARVPQDVETICLKALEKDPWRRYESMAQLAADLRAFLAGKPISAKPSGPFTKMWKFARRRRAAVVAGALALLLMLAVPLTIWVQESRADEAVAETKQTAERQKVDAVKRQLVATQKLLRGQMDDLLPIVATPGLEPELRRMISRIVASYRRIYESDLRTRTVRMDLIQTMQSEGRAYLWIREFDKARRSLLEAARLSAALTDDYPNKRIAWIIRVGCYTDIGSLANIVGDADEVRRATKMAASCFVRAQATEPDALSDILAEIGLQQRVLRIAWELSDLDGAVPDYKKTLDELGLAIEGFRKLPKERREAQNNYRFYFIASQRRAHLLMRQGRLKDAATENARATSLARSYLARFKDHPKWLMFLAEVLRTDAHLATLRKDWQAARKTCMEAEAVLLRVGGAAPRLLQHRSDLLVLYTHWTTLEMQAGNMKAAQAVADKAVEFAESSLKDAKDDARVSRSFAKLLEMSGTTRLLTKPSNIKEAELRIRRALKLQKQLATKLPKWWAIHNDIATARRNYGVCLTRLRRLDDATVVLKAGVRSRQKAYTLRPGDKLVRKTLLGDLNNNLGVAARRVDHAWLAELAMQLRQVDQRPAVTAHVAGVFAGCKALAAYVASSHGDADGSLKKAQEEYAARSFETLDLAIARGLRDKSVLQRSAFKPLRGDPRLAEAERRMERAGDKEKR